MAGKVDDEEIADPCELCELETEEGSRVAFIHGKEFFHHPCYNAVRRLERTADLSDAASKDKNKTQQTVLTNLKKTKVKWRKMGLAIAVKQGRARLVLGRVTALENWAPLASLFSNHSFCRFSPGFVNFHLIFIDS